MTSRGSLASAVCAWAILWLACVEVVPVASIKLAAPAAMPDASVPQIRWGDYAATLDVPKCPDGGILLVDRLDDEFEGGRSLSSRDLAGAHLSFREAITIASNRGGPHSILFDEEVFPVDGGQVVLLRRDLFIPPLLTQTCIDGRHRGVTFAWEPSISVGCPNCSWELGEGSLLVGITMQDIPWTLTIRGGGQVAGCRLNGEYAINLHSASKFGPGNVLGPFGPEIAVQSFSGAPLTIEGNFIGYDPTTGRLLTPFRTGITGAGPLNMTANVVLAIANFFGRPSGSTITHNAFGAIPEGLPRVADTVVPRGATGAWMGGGGEIGPGNVFRGFQTAIFAASSLPRITRNSISGNDKGIDSGGPVASIEAVDGGWVTGVCPEDGTVELFTDPPGPRRNIR